MAQCSFLLLDGLVQTSGLGRVVELGQAAGKEIQITIDVNRIQERDCLDLSVWGSSDGENWRTRPILRIPRKYYCGTSHIRLDLSDTGWVRYLQIEFHVLPGTSSASALAEVHISAAPVEDRVLVAAV